MRELRAFACHSSRDSEYVRAVSAFLKRHFPVFLYEDFQRADAPFTGTIDLHLANANVFLVFGGETFGGYCIDEVNTVMSKVRGSRPQVVPLILHPDARKHETFQGLLGAYPCLEACDVRGNLVAASQCARDIVGRLSESGRPVAWRAEDDLPYNPHLFSYEKDIIRFYARTMDLGPDLYTKGETPEDENQRAMYRDKLAEGCPTHWPSVTDLRQYLFAQCDVKTISARDASDASVLISKFESEHCSSGGKYTVLAVRVTEGPDSGRWTIAGFDDARALKVINDPQHELLVELENELPNRNKFIELATTALGRTRFSHGNVYRQTDNVQTDFGDFRPDTAKVGAAALRGFTTHKHHLNFPEAGPRRSLVFPRTGGARGQLEVAVLVSGGIAPGINAVIDGIVQRHYKYMEHYTHALAISGYSNGFHGVLLGQPCPLVPSRREAGATFPPTRETATLGGSMLGTYRMDSLLHPDSRLRKLAEVAARLDQIDILYMIGGDGTMRAAHALWSVASQRAREGHREFPLSVVAIPKTMDNDILWVWQSFGFMSAVEKAREFIHHLHTEISSNPRLCVLQLFGSDSGFVVSHAVLACAAGQCDLALIPEVKFSLLGIADHLERLINGRDEPIPRALVVMAETAIAEDAAWYVDQSRNVPSGLPQNSAADIAAVRNRLELTETEKGEILSFEKMRAHGDRIQGQTNDALRRAGLKMVMQGLEAILSRRGIRGRVHWENLRMVANEPRHLLRAIPPSTSDIIMAQRLGTLAVDNAMAGYTDFMISQWLTEFVLVPLKLVVLGRKRIPESGIFWKSILAKTHQPSDLVAPWPRP